MISVEESGLTLLICENEALDTSTPRGKNAFGKLVLDAEMEADLVSARVKVALQVAKKRGKKLGTRNKKVKGKGAKARRNNALQPSRDLLPFVKKWHDKGFGKKSIRDKLNNNAKALALNGGSTFYLTKVQRIIANQTMLKLLS